MRVKNKNGMYLALTTTPVKRQCQYKPDMFYWTCRRELSYNFSGTDAAHSAGEQHADSSFTVEL